MLAIGNIFEVLQMKDIYKRGIQINTVLELALQFNNMKVFALLGIMALAAAKPKGEYLYIISTSIFFSNVRYISLPEMPTITFFVSYNHSQSPTQNVIYDHSQSRDLNLSRI